MRQAALSSGSLMPAPSTSNCVAKPPSTTLASGSRHDIEHLACVSQRCSVVSMDMVGATSWGSIEVDEVEADAIAVVVVAGLPKTEPVMSWSVACVVMQNWEAREMSRGGSAIVVATEGAVEGVAGLLVTSCSRSGQRGGGGP